MRSLSRCLGGRDARIPFATPSWQRRSVSSVVRQMNPRGFVGDYRQLNHTSDPETQKQVARCLKESTNTLLCGPRGSGKLTILKAIAEKLRKKKQNVAVVSADGFRANRIDGLLIHHFLGLRLNRDELPSQEQLEGSFERHIRHVESTFDNIIPSLATADVLLVDSLEKLPPVLLLTMDSVCRRVRSQPNSAFGGLRVVATADFWQLEVMPSSDLGKSIFQIPHWDELFPKQLLLEKIHGQDPQLTEYVHKAHFGLLTHKDIAALEELSQNGSTSANSSTATARGASSRGGNAQLHQRSFQPVQSHFDVVTKQVHRFPKQPLVRILPPRIQALRRTEIGALVLSLLLQSSVAHQFGLFSSLNVEAGAPVHLLYDGTEAYGVPAGTPGQVLEVKDHFVQVSFPSVHRTVDIPRTHITVYVDRYPEITYQLQQFPLFPRELLSPANIQIYGKAYNVEIDGVKLADTNDLGNLLARMRSFGDFTLKNTKQFVKLDGMVHEPTRIYYNKIAGNPISPNADQWCRNCKTHIPTSEFYAHWQKCVSSVRWCSVCDTVIPLSRLEAHMEKHQIVMCMDCAQAIEWRNWEAHRLTCLPMLREVSADNEFLPVRTRQLALEVGVDKRDLHTMKAFNRSLLPKSRKDVISRSL